jgi:tRNA-2-methylthio-N6-dimethylallyladenosine synthase
MSKLKYHIITIGCQMNVSDSERLAAFLESQDFKLAVDFKKADLVIINTCGVKQMAENRAYSLVNKIRQENEGAKIIISGCLSRREDVAKRLIGQVDWFLPIGEMLQIPGLLKEVIFQPSYSLDEYRLKEGERYLTIKPKHSSDFKAYVPIGNGCNNFCSYCVVPYARGREVYRAASEVKREVWDLISHGYKEITLIAQNVNSYHDKNYDFPKLLRDLIKIPGKFWLRFSSSHPKDMSAELIAAIASSPKVCPHLHLALQSGDDQILKAMNRGYSAEHYLKLIEKIRAVKPGIAITTDIIVGFPGETKTQFLNTIKLFKAINFDLAYISKYSPRFGTAAYSLKDNVSLEEKKRRVNEVNELLKIIAAKNNQQHLGETMEVLVDGLNRRGQYYGKTGSYQTVLFRVASDVLGDSGKNYLPKKKIIGNFVKVKIIKARPFGLEGELMLEKNKKG